MSKFLALLLLWTDVPAPEPGREVRLELQNVAIEAELLDRCECAYWLADPDRWNDDLDSLRRRRDDLISAPLLCEADAFPSHDTTTSFLSFNRSYRERINLDLLVYPCKRAGLEPAVKDAEYLFAVWDAVDDASNPNALVVTRRRGLATLRELVGKDAYFSARLPPPVPLWRFREVR